MKLNRLVAYLIGLTALAASLLVYLEYIYLLGFPDGFVTELELAEKRLAGIFIGTSVTLGTGFLYLGWMAAKKKISRMLFAAIIFYLIFITSVAFIDYYYHLNVLGSGGG